jgi:hypothetical protein
MRPRRTRSATGEIALLALDLTEAVQELTGGAFTSFRSISVETVAAGNTVNVIRPGAIVVARYRGLRATTGNIGYGGRSTRNGTIKSAAVMLDATSIASPISVSCCATHELGHALGYHHVESRPSVMNPRVGNAITDFDRNVIRYVARRPTRERLRALSHRCTPGCSSSHPKPRQMLNPYTTL